MSRSVVVHAAKIPEPIQRRSRKVRQVAGDAVYVNACDDRPWAEVPLFTPTADVVVCAACQYIVEVNRAKRGEVG